MKKFTKEELLQFNEQLLGRGAPTTHDGVGYNKADFGACATYYYGLSDAQYADLAKRLVKYCNSQLKICKETMKETAKELRSVAGDRDRSDGISVSISEKETMISFRYNPTFIETIKKQPIRKFDFDSKNWLVPNNKAIEVLDALESVGADVNNARKYLLDNASNSPAEAEEKPQSEILFKRNQDKVVVKFKYNQVVVDTIKSLDKKLRKWDADSKFWEIEYVAYEQLCSKLEGCNFVEKEF